MVLNDRFLLLITPFLSDFLLYAPPTENGARSQFIIINPTRTHENYSKSYLDSLASGI